MSFNTTKVSQLIQMGLLRCVPQICAAILRSFAVIEFVGLQHPLR